MTLLSFVSPGDTSMQPDTRWQYVYGIVRAEDPLLFEVDGVDDAEAVYTVGVDGLAAVTSAIARPSLQGLERPAIIHNLNLHQRVLEAVQQDCAVLPVKFGTILPDEARLRALLRQEAVTLETTLAVYAGKRQFEVVMLWDLARVFALIAAEAPIVALKAEIAGKGPDESVGERVALGQMVHTMLQQRRALLGQELIAQLRDLADDLVVNPLMDDSMVVNIALLVDDARRALLDERLDALDEQYGRSLQIRCVGPLPAYSFATLLVQAPAFPEVDAARQLLGLSEVASYVEIRRAFRALAAQWHPDYNQLAEDAPAQMGRLTSAYRLLSAISHAQAPGPGAADWPCHLDRATIEGTVLLTVTRQGDGAQPDGGPPA